MPRANRLTNEQRLERAVLAACRDLEAIAAGFRRSRNRKSLRCGHSLTKAIAPIAAAPGRLKMRQITALSRLLNYCLQYAPDAQIDAVVGSFQTVRRLEALGRVVDSGTLVGIAWQKVKPADLRNSSHVLDGLELERDRLKILVTEAVRKRDDFAREQADLRVFLRLLGSR